jgi:hypothetical protein
MFETEPREISWDGDVEASIVTSLKSNQAKSNASEPVMQNNGRIDARGVLKTSTLRLLEVTRSTV